MENVIEPNESSTFRILSDAEVAQIQNPQEQQQEQQDFVEQPPVEQEAVQQYNESYSDEDVDSTVLSYLSEKLGRQFSSFDELTQREQMQLDERVKAIVDFVSETGRSPQDWFAYQSLNPSEMDDLTAIKVNLAGQYPDLNNEDLDLLVQSKYKVDETMYSQEEVRLSRLQARIDAAEARKNIEEVRQKYKAPESSREQIQSPFDDSWYETMRNEVEALEGIEFQLAGGKTFTFGLDPRYKSDLVSKNARIEEYFDSYIDNNGNWDFDKFNTHRAVIDNVDKIIASVYQQGLSDGRRNIVNVASNASSSSPARSGGQGPSKLAQQLREALGDNQGMIFNV